MNITGRIARLELAETFVIARDSTDIAEVVQVEIRHGDVSGYGEGAPIERYEESAESALAYVEEHAEALGDDPFALDEIEARLAPREWAARAAIDGGAPRPAGETRSTCRCGGCSGSAVKGRRRRGRSGSAIPTTWRAAPRRRSTSPA